MSIFWTTAFLTGFIGSLHCVGMCGPIALALPIGGMSPVKVVFSRIIYNVGRILTYSFIGFLMGYFGQAFFFSGLQQEVSIGIGLFLLSSFLFSQKFLKIQALQWFTARLKQSFASVFRQKTLASMLLLGILNGLLPCGFLYLAAAGSVVTGSPTDGMIYMAIFGLGTTPAMFTIGLMTRMMNATMRRRVNKYSPVFSIILALFFIIRGLNLGIPYLSPKFEKSQVTQREMTVCHGKKSEK